MSARRGSAARWSVASSSMSPMRCDGENENENKTTYATRDMRVTLLRGRRRPHGYGDGLVEHGDADVAHLLAAQRREREREALLPEQRVCVTGEQVSQ